MSNGTTFCLNPTYYIGMDLHSNNVVVCILQNAANNDGSLTKKVIRRAKVKLSPDLSELYEFLLPFCKWNLLKIGTVFRNEWDSKLLRGGTL